MNTRELQQYILDWNSKAQEYYTSRGAGGFALAIQKRIEKLQDTHPGVDSLFVQYLVKAAPAFKNANQEKLT